MQNSLNDLLNAELDLVLELWFFLVAGGVAHHQLNGASRKALDLLALESLV